ncbi:hypothetical protein R6Q57_000975 [Mikania cordata]
MPPSTTYPYDALPSTPQQPQYFVVLLPFYSSSGRRKRCRRYLYSTITVLLAAALYFLWPSGPYLNVVLAVRIKVRNPDVYSLDYQSLNVSVEYKGEHLGFVTSVANSGGRVASVEVGGGGGRMASARIGSGRD